MRDWEVGYGGDKVKVRGDVEIFESLDGVEFGVEMWEDVWGGGGGRKVDWIRGEGLVRVGERVVRVVKGRNGEKGGRKIVSREK